MKIIIVCQTMTYLSGSSLYNYTLAKELSKEHDVSVMSLWGKNYLRDDLEDLGVKCIRETNDEYDLAIVSQKDLIKKLCYFKK